MGLHERAAASTADGNPLAHLRCEESPEPCDDNDETESQSRECSSRHGELVVSGRNCPPLASLTSNLPKKKADSPIQYGGSILAAGFTPEVGAFCTPIARRFGIPLNTPKNASRFRWINGCAARCGNNANQPFGRLSRRVLKCWTRNPPNACLRPFTLDSFSTVLCMQCGCTARGTPALCNPASVMRCPDSHLSRGFISSLVFVTARQFLTSVE